MLQFFKTWMLPLAMLTGALFYPFFQRLSFLTPWLIFTMLFITYCKLSFRDLKFTRLHAILLLIQVVGCMVVYAILYKYDSLLAEGIMICVLAPTATAAVVITGMLGGNMACLAAYSLLSNLAVALISPVIFSFIGSHSDTPFLESFLYICRQVMPLLILPFVGALFLERILPVLHGKIRKLQGLSFYLWACGLTIVTGKTVFFIMQQDATTYTEMWVMALFSLLICVVQFVSGRSIGSHYGETVAGGQGLGQKNTILAIWMAQVYLTPLASVAPALYVLWQNSINSWQLWKKSKK